MPNFFPLIANATANVIQELPSGSLLDLSQSGIANSGNISVSGAVSATGNITANYFVGNGSLLTGISGGTANTGNVTFNDQVIQGTGDQYGGGGLYLAPGTDSTGNLQYLRVRGGDYPTHIHFDTGNRDYYDQYFGDDGKYLKLIAGESGGTAGAVEIGTASGQATWIFGSDGNLTFPNDANIAIVGNITNFNTGANGFLGLNSFDAGGNNIAAVNLSSIDGLVGISTYNPATDSDYHWAFNNNGSTIFPTLTVDLHNGGNQSGQTLQFGDPNQQAFITGPAPAANVNAQRLIIQGQRGSGTGEGGDVYVWGGDSDINGGDIKIYAGDADSGVSGRGGNIHISGGTGQNPGGEISLIGGQTYNGQGAPVVVAGGGGSTTGGNVDLRGGGGDITGGPISLVAGSGLTTGGNVDITGGQSAAGLPGYGNVNIHAGASSWAFDNTGNLTVPGNILGSGNILIAPDSASSSSYLDIYLTGGPDIHIASNDNSIVIGRDTGANIFVGNDGEVSIRTDNGATPQVWNFDNTGNLTVPGGMIINGNINTLGTQTALLQPTDDLPLAFIASGANGSVTSFWAEDFANLMTSNIAAIYTPLQNTQTVRIVTGNNGGNIAIYDFDNAGMFTAATVCATGNVYAGNVSASGNISAGNFIGGGSNVELVAGTSSWSFETPGRSVWPVVPLANLTVVAGGRAFINDGNLIAAGNFGQQVGSGGSNTVPVWSDGTNWYIG